MGDDTASSGSNRRRTGDDDKPGEAGPYPARSLSAHTGDKTRVAPVLSSRMTHTSRTVLVSVDRNIEDHGASESSISLVRADGLGRMVGPPQIPQFDAANGS
jgi:hypothetical protein